MTVILAKGTFFFRLMSVCRMPAAAPILFRSRFRRAGNARRHVSFGSLPEKQIVAARSR